jgi:hypothetical protein
MIEMKKLIIFWGAIFAVGMGYAQTHDRLDSMKQLLRTDSVAFSQFRSAGMCRVIDLLTKKRGLDRLFEYYCSDIDAQHYPLFSAIPYEKLRPIIDQYYLASIDSVILELRKHDEYFNKNRSPFLIAETIFAPTPQVYELYLDVIDDDDSYSFFQADNDIGWSVWRFFPNTLHSENRFSKDV